MVHIPHPDQKAVLPASLLPYITLVLLCHSSSMTSTTTTSCYILYLLSVSHLECFWEGRDLCLFITVSPPLRTKSGMCSINIYWRQLGGRKEFGEILHKEIQLNNLQGLTKTRKGLLIKTQNTLIPSLISDYSVIYKIFLKYK